MLGTSQLGQTHGKLTTRRQLVRTHLLLEPVAYHIVAYSTQPQVTQVQYKVLTG
jgi:hypothetical protein